MRALNRTRTILGTTVLIFVLSVWCAAQQYGYPQSSYPQSNRGYGQSSDLVVTQNPVLEYADPHTITIMWRTNDAANSMVRFGTDPNNLGSGPDQVVQLNDEARTHRVEMRNRFEPGTTYYFQLISDRGNGDSIVSPLFTAQTPPQGSEPIRNQRLMIARNSGYDNRYADNNRDADDDTYYDRNRSNNRYNNGYANNGWRRRNDEYAGNRNYGYGQQRLPQGEQRLPQGDETATIQITRPPMLQLLSDTVAVITWRTNAPSSSIVHYGTNAGSLTQTAQAPWGETMHTVTIQNLQPGTRYFFNVTSGQAEGTGTATNSDTVSFTTQPQGARPLHGVRPGLQ